MEKTMYSKRITYINKYNKKITRECIRLMQYEYYTFIDYYKENDGKKVWLGDIIENENIIKIEEVK